MISKDGQATIMDFGLARLTEASRLTKVDTAMGTVAYMSPEQAQGMEVDSRSDIWALGCVLYEMVSGQRPFQGQYDQALLYEIVHEQPAPLTGLRTAVPMELEFIAGKCLAKDREDRTGVAQEVARELRILSDKLKSGHSTVFRAAPMTGAVAATMAAGQTVNPAEALPPDAMVVQRKSHRVLQGLVALFAIAFLGLLAIYFTESSPDTPTRRFSFSQEGLGTASISPDGRYIAFSAQTDDEASLWLRAIGTETAREIPEARGAKSDFAWSPDSRDIVFSTTTEIKRVGIGGGDPITLGDLPRAGAGLRGNGFQGASWSPGGERIVYSAAGRLFEIPARGGEGQILIEGGTGPARNPHFLPTRNGPEALVYQTIADGNQIWLLNLETGERVQVGSGYAPVYSQEGYLIHGSDGGVHALPFSLARLEPTGDPFPIAKDGRRASVALDGTLLIQEGLGSGPSPRTLVWRNRAGELLEKIGQPQRGMVGPALSPDGRRIAVASRENGNLDIWVHDLPRATKTRLTFDSGLKRTPTWSPSGAEVTYWVSGNEVAGLGSRASDGTGEAVTLLESTNPVTYPDWSPDGRYLVYYEITPETQRDIRYVDLQADGDAPAPVTFVGTAANELLPAFSPDGRFLADVSDESGPHEVYVRPFPDGAGKWQVSVNGGMHPRWSRSGGELFYVENSTLMAVSVSTESTFALGQPQPLFESADLHSTISRNHDVSADGKRFVMITPVEDGDAEAAPSGVIRVVLNWYEEFRDREQ